MGITNFLKDMIGPKIIINTIQNQDPDELGRELAQVVDKACDSEFGPAKSEKIQKVLVPFLHKLMMSFNKELLKVLLFILIPVYLCGCGYHARAWKDAEGWHYESNRPSSFKATEDSFEGDGKGEPFFDIDIPLNKIGG